MAVVEFALRAGEYNAHYEGAYSEREMAWRRAGAVEKTRNLNALLGARALHVRTVLEVGCGTGAVLSAVRTAAIGTVHEGVDIADPSKHTDAATLIEGISLRTYDGVRLPYADHSFDLVFASHVLEHVEDERGFLRELQRVSAKWVYIEVPCELHARSSTKALQATLNIGHINAYNPEAFALKLTTSGMSLLGMQVFDHIDEVYAFKPSRSKAVIGKVLRRLLLGLSPQIATRVFTYHCGAIAGVSAEVA